MANQAVMNNLKKYVEKMGLKTIDNVADGIQSTAKAYVPVKTGLLKSSIGVIRDRGKKENLVIADTKYAWFVEMGTQKMAPRAYMRNALSRIMAKFS